jgi:pimeloyl-ACP methyl ester carboxylesterase
VETAQTLNVIERGEGQPVVFLHGQLVTHADWPRHIIDPLSRKCRVMTLDRAGYGDSGSEGNHASPYAQASGLQNELRARGVTAPILVGHSFGGMVALAFAARFPVQALVLLAPLCFPEARIEHAWLAPRSMPAFGSVWSRLMVGAGIDRAVLEMAHALMFFPAAPPAAWRASYPFDQILEPAHLAWEGEEAASVHPLSWLGYRNWSAITAPASVLVGAQDAVASIYRHGALLPLVLKQARLMRFPGVGHMVHHLRPEAVLAAIEHYLPGDLGAEVLDDGQEEVFSRAEVTLGRIEHSGRLASD